MKRFPLVFKHYCMRTLKDKTGLLAQVALPLGLILLVVFIFSNQGSNMMVDGYNMAHTEIVHLFMLFFQLLNGLYVADYMFEDLKESRKWRLAAAPVDRNVYFLAIMLGSWVVAIIQGLLILGVSWLLLDVYLENMGIILLVLVGVSLFSHFMSLLLFYFTKDRSQANAVGFVMSFGIGILAGVMPFDLASMTGLSIFEFFRVYGTPLSAAYRALNFSGLHQILMERSPDMAIVNQAILILFGFVVVTGSIAYMVGKVKKV